MPATRVITLGTAGGPRWWPAESGRVPRAGISTAVVVGDRHYLVDAGLGAGRMMQRAGLEISGLAGVFLTHLHSDHTTDLANLAIFGLYRLDGSGPVIPIIGPGDRGMLPPVSSRATTMPTPIAPARPTPGTADMFRLLMEAHATDLNDRVLDALRPSPLDLFRASDIAIPADVNFHANDRPTPDMAPFVVFEDDRVRVSATLVEHPPIAPAFAFRFDTDDGSVAISGDTRETANMARIARDVDLLLHEAIDFDWIDGLYPEGSGAEAQATRDHHYRSHTSIEGAVRIAQSAGAHNLALHHLVPGSVPHSMWGRGETLMPGRFFVPDDLDSFTLGTHFTARNGQ